MDNSAYQKLIVWQKSMQLAKNIYQITKLLPSDEKYGLVSQMRRAAVSIPSNIAEGYSRNSTKDYIRFLMIATASKSELETQLLLCRELEFLTDEQAASSLLLCKEIGKIISATTVSLINKGFPL